MYHPIETSSCFLIKQALRFSCFFIRKKIITAFMQIFDSRLDAAECANAISHHYKMFMKAIQKKALNHEILKVL